MGNWPEGMRLALYPKAALSQDQLDYLDQRLAAPEHRNDQGPPRVWHIYQSYLYAFVHNDSGKPIAISEASGRPVAIPGWWIDSDYRGKGYGNELVDLLAEFLAADGVTAIGRIPIDTHNGQYNEQSSKLAKRLRAHFAETRR